MNASLFMRTLAGIDRIGGKNNEAYATTSLKLKNFLTI